MKNIPRCFLLAGFVLLSACSSVPIPGKDPEIQMPERWATPSTNAIETPETWWKNFGDPKLDQVSEQALRRNNDFATATIRVRRAQLQAAQVDTNLTPNVAVGANSARSRRL